jgi:hypothetical protein
MHPVGELDLEEPVDPAAQGGALGGREDVRDAHHA